MWRLEGFALYKCHLTGVTAFFLSLDLRCYSPGTGQLPFGGMGGGC